MRKNFGAKPLTYPQPVLIIATYDEDGTPNAMNAAWGGISEINQISICLSAEKFAQAWRIYRKHGRSSSRGGLRLCGDNFR